MTASHRPGGSLARTLGVRHAVTVGMGSMLGAGLFAVWGPAARAAGSWLLLSLLLVAVVAGANAYSSAVLAARYPEAGGAYVYGTRRLGVLPGYLAGWCFVVGKTASCAAMALTLGAYLAVGHERLSAVVAVVAATAANLGGVRRSAALSFIIVSLVLSTVGGLVARVVVQGWGTGCLDLCAGLASGADFSAYGVAQAAGLLFFAFAGYARIATLGEDVREPRRTIGRAMAITFSAVLVVYAGVAVLVVGVLGVPDLARSADPLADVASLVGSPSWAWLVRAAAVSAALGALVNLMLGISRTSVAMARDGHLPAVLARVDGPHRVPRVAEAGVGMVLLVIVLGADLRGAIGFSSFAVLLYYAVANAAALTIRAPGLRSLVPVVGLVGCVALALTLPWASVLGGVAVLALGLAAYVVRRAAFRLRERASSPRLER